MQPYELLQFLPHWVGVLLNTIGKDAFLNVRGIEILKSCLSGVLFWCRMVHLRVWIVDVGWSVLSIYLSMRWFTVDKCESNTSDGILPITSI